MKDLIAKITAKPWVAHLIRAFGRYTERLGMQFAAAITYFSVLALIPILMLGFAITGFVLTNVRPDLIDDVVRAFNDLLGGSGATRARISELVTGWLSDYAAIGIVGLLTAAYSGAGWINNLKNAVRAQWRTDFDDPEPAPNIVVNTLKNLLTLLGLVVAVAVTFGLAALSTSLSSAVLDWFGLSGIGWLKPVLQFVPIVFSVGAGWVLFVYLYSVLPAHRKPFSIVRRGALIGAIGLAVLQYLASFLISVFAGNQAASLFGPVITLMLFFDLFAQLVLFVAAWIASAEVEPPAGLHDAKAVASSARDGSTDEPVVVPSVGTGLTDGSAVSDPAKPEVLVSQKVAAQSVQVGIGAGWVTGTATGVGLGAAIAWLAGRIAARKR